MLGKVFAISISSKKGTKKVPVATSMFVAGRGIEGDAHAGEPLRQVSLLASESIDKMRVNGAKVGPGDFAENITTLGVDLSVLKIGSRLRLGDGILLEVTQIGKKCHDRCEIFKQVGDCVMPREGIFAKVLQGGELKTGDDIEVL